MQDRRKGEGEEAETVPGSTSFRGLRNSQLHAGSFMSSGSSFPDRKPPENYMVPPHEFHVELNILLFLGIVSDETNATW